MIARNRVRNRAMTKRKVKVVCKTVGFEIIFFADQNILILLVWDHHSEKIFRMRK